MSILNRNKKISLEILYGTELVTGAIFLFTLPYFSCLLGLFIYQLLNSFLFKKLLVIQATIYESIFRYVVFIVLALGIGCAIIGFAIPTFFTIPYLIINHIIPILMIFHLFVTLMDLKILVCKPKQSSMSHY